MKNKKAYVSINETKEQVKFFRALVRNTDQLYSKETSRIYYRSDTSFSLGKKVCVVPLKKVTKGYIIYVCNNVYSIGYFIYITNKEFDQIKLFNFKIDSDVNISCWRHLNYFQGILDEFVHPLAKLENDVVSLEWKIQYDKEKLERTLKEKAKLLARY